jgi:hypothetical protein
VNATAAILVLGLRPAGPRWVRCDAPGELPFARLGKHYSCAPHMALIDRLRLAETLPGWPRVRMLARQGGHRSAAGRRWG